MPPVRILIVDDHRILRDGLKLLFEAEPGFDVVGEASTAAEAIERVRELAPDLLLLDLTMPHGSGLDVLRALRETPTRTRTLLLTGAIDSQEVVEALVLGARGLVLKGAAPPLLFRALRAVMAGEYWVEQDRVPDLIDTLRRLGGPRAVTPAASLTPRELAVVAAIVGGATNREIAEQLGISEQTVKNHVSNIFDKVGVSNRLELALYAIHHELLDQRRRPDVAARDGAGELQLVAAGPPAPNRPESV